MLMARSGSGKVLVPRGVGFLSSDELGRKKDDRGSWTIAVVWSMDGVASSVRGHTG
jgi:hypothetical protein